MAAAPLSAEVEAKLLVPEARYVRALAALRTLGAYRLRPRGRQHLRSIYLDTADWALLRHGVALRVRQAGRRWETTAKWMGHVHGLVHERPEITVPLPRPPHPPYHLPAGPLHVWLAALIAGRRLAPVLCTDIWRTRRDVLGADAGALRRRVAELALDDVTLRASGRSARSVQRYCEVEIELRSGRRHDLDVLAGLLRHRFSLTPSHDSTFVRGLTMRGISPLAGTSPAPPIAAGDSVAQGVRTIIAEQLARLRRHDPGTRLGRDAGALHDFRVAVRRLRAALRTFPQAVSPAAAASLRRELRWLGQVSGRVRDLDVQLARLQRPAAAVPAARGTAMRPLRAHLHAERRRQREAMLAALDSPRYFRLLRRLEHLGLERSACADAPPLARAGRRALKRAFHRLLACGDDIGARPADAELHALRIRAKRLRYVLEFLQGIAGKPARRVIKHVVQLQNVLGAHHDAVVAAACIRRYAEASSRRQAAAARRTLAGWATSEGRRARRAAAAFAKAWKQFRRRRTVSDMRAVLDRLRAAAHQVPSAPSGKRS
jgi:inorganic triphosphatase YgiF